jgi:hypothetical protein
MGLGQTSIASKTAWRDHSGGCQRGTGSSCFTRAHQKRIVCIKQQPLSDGSWVRMSSPRTKIVTSGVIGVNGAVLANSLDLHGTGTESFLLQLLSVMYLGLACTLVALIFALAMAAVFGSPVRRPWSLATLAIILGRPCSHLPSAIPDSAESLKKPQHTSGSSKSQQNHRAR